MRPNPEFFKGCLGENDECGVFGRGAHAVRGRIVSRPGASGGDIWKKKKGPRQSAQSIGGPKRVCILAMIWSRACR